MSTPSKQENFLQWLNEEIEDADSHGMAAKYDHYWSGYKQALKDVRAYFTGEYDAK